MVEDGPPPAPTLGNAWRRPDVDGRLVELLGRAPLHPRGPGALTRLGFDSDAARAPAPD
jgi:hypothetical protein